jgi:hypothetical protein
MTNNLGTNLPIVIKDNGFLKLQSFFKHVTLPINCVFLFCIDLQVTPPRGVNNNALAYLSLVFHHNEIQG